MPPSYGICHHLTLLQISIQGLSKMLTSFEKNGSALKSHKLKNCKLVDRRNLNPSFTKGGGGGGGGEVEPTLKDFSSITFEKNKLETPTLHNPTLTIYTLGGTINPI